MAAMWPALTASKCTPNQSNLSPWTPDCRNTGTILLILACLFGFLPMAWGMPARIGCPPLHGHFVGSRALDHQASDSDRLSFFESCAYLAGRNLSPKPSAAGLFDSEMNQPCQMVFGNDGLSAFAAVPWLLIASMKAGQWSTTPLNHRVRLRLAPWGVSMDVRSTGGGVRLLIVASLGHSRRRYLGLCRLLVLHERAQLILDTEDTFSRMPKALMCLSICLPLASLRYPDDRHKGLTHVGPDLSPAEFSAWPWSSSAGSPPWAVVLADTRQGDTRKAESRTSNFASVEKVFAVLMIFTRLCHGLRPRLQTMFQRGRARCADCWRTAEPVR